MHMSRGEETFCIEVEENNIAEQGMTRERGAVAGVFCGPWGIRTCE